MDHPKRGAKSLYDCLVCFIYFSPTRYKSIYLDREGQKKHFIAVDNFPAEKDHCFSFLIILLFFWSCETPQIYEKLSR